MLRNTFLHIPGVGIQTERHLWASGILSWDDCMRRDLLSISYRKQHHIRGHLEQSIRQLSNHNPQFFGDYMPTNQLWRMFPEFRDATAYLDIETTGLDTWGSHITTIALYDGKSIYQYVYGQNLEAFREDIQNYKVIVTYNGKCFDVPIIQRSLNLRMNHVHIDLRYVLRSLGYRGGLKGCEKQLGIDRGELEGLDGFFAVLLWNDFVRNKNDKALETLLAYNAEDVINLETLMVLSYNLKLNDTDILAVPQLPVPCPQLISLVPHRSTIARIRKEYHMTYVHE